MAPSQIFVAVVIIILFLVMVFIGNKNSKPKRLRPLASIAFGFIVAGIILAKTE